MTEHHGEVSRTMEHPVAADSTVRIRLDISYDGTDFSGWARQPGQRTVQGAIEDALASILRTAERPALTVAGRTDAGVHATGQVAHVDLPAKAWQRVGESLPRRLAGLLPRDVRVTSVAPAPPGFDARFSAVGRRYAYRVCDAPYGVEPLRRHYVLWHPRPLDAAAMNAAGSLLLGEHDFAAFCRRREGATTIRWLRRLAWTRTGPHDLVAEVVADAFCHSMVRSLVGAMLAIGEGRKPPEFAAEALAGLKRPSSVTVVEPHGLTLEEVYYPSDDRLAEQAVTARRIRTLIPDVGASPDTE
jgi:tRNA pseudouridine38-40 synthase